MTTRKTRFSANPLSWLTAGLLALGMVPLAAIDHTAQAQSYSWNNVQIIAGGYVDGIIAHPAQQGLFYARTDVGGAYRYNSSTSSWVPLTDWTTAANWYQLGIDSIAIDPNNVNMLFAVAGEYTNDWDGDAAFLVSTNQGASFTSYALPFHAGANNNGRNAGERLQVDPNKGSILFYGTWNDSSQSSTNGLWTSTNTGQSWSRITSFPALSSDGTGAGIAFIAPYKASASSGKATQTIFVGVSTSSTASTLYMTTNGGTSWSAVSGAPTGLFPTRGLIGVDGNLYITYANAIGPNSITSGQVWKYSIGLKTWTNITPPNPNSYSYGYSSLALDPELSGTVVVATIDRWYPGDTMFRSTNAGSSWVDVGALATRNSSLSPYVNWGASSAGFGNWVAGLVIDPFNSAHAIYGTGQTVWTTTNLTNATSGTATSWTVGGLGIEETVPAALISPSSGAPLISGIGDVCGFVHNSLTVSPPAGMFTNPLCSSTSSLDWAKSSPATIVRVGSGSSPFGAVSTNGGSSWTPFASQAGSTAGAGSVAISADAATIVWAPSDVAPSYSTNNGSSWTSLSGSLPTGVQLLSDGYSASLFYAWDASTGVFYASGNKGVSWYTASSGVTSGGKAANVAGIQGDLWLATSGGLYHSTNSGTSFTQLSNVTSATAVGFGKAASGASYPTIYLIGTVSGTTGIFRSTNAGSSWTQINDTAHQWGGPSVITGDPKTFGNVYIGTPGRGIVYGTSAN